jgi:hypothetical protein
MAKNEKTSKKLGTIGSKALRGKKLTAKESRAAGGSLMTQRPDKKKRV